MSFVLKNSFWVYLNLFAFVLQTFSTAIPNSAWAHDPVKQVEQVQPSAKEEQKEAEGLACEILAGVKSAGKKAINALGWITGIKPMVQALRDPIARSKFGITWKQGIVNTPMGSYLSVILATLTVLLAGGDPNYMALLPISALFWFRTSESYTGYNFTNMARFSILQSKDFTADQKYWINIWYSGFWYSIILNLSSMIQDQIFGHKEEDQVWKSSMILMSLGFPFISQWLTMTYVQPKYILTNISDVEINKIKEKRNRSNVLQAERQRVEDYFKIEKGIKDKIEHLKSKLKENVFANNEDRKKAKTDLKKAEIELEMHPNVFPQAEAYFEGLKFLMDGTPDDQPIPNERIAEYKRGRQWVTTKVSIVMVSLYFYYRWLVLGDKPNYLAGDFRPIPWAVQHLSWIKDHPTESSAAALTLVPTFFLIRWGFKGAREWLLPLVTKSPEDRQKDILSKMRIEDNGTGGTAGLDSQDEIDLATLKADFQAQVDCNKGSKAACERVQAIQTDLTDFLKNEAVKSEGSAEEDGPTAALPSEGPK